MMLPIFLFQKTHESLVLIPSRKDSFKIKSNSIFILKWNLDPSEHKAIFWDYNSTVTECEMSL